MKKICLLMLLFCSLLMMQSQAQNDVFTKRIDSLVQDAVQKGIFSGTVLVANKGTVTYRKSYGYADWEKKTPITEGTIFSIGSITKGYTREIIEQLIKEGKLKKSDKLFDYLPIYNSEQGKKITIEHLLDMKAGLDDYTQHPDEQKLFDRAVTLEEVIALIRQQPLLYEPGTRRRYSNSNYVLLGALIEKITGNTFQQAVQERILAPLQLQHTYTDFASIHQHPQRGVATMLTVDGEKRSVYRMEPPKPDGEFYATADDLLKFAQALKSGTLPSGMQMKQFAMAGGSEYLNAFALQLPNDLTAVVVSNMGEIANALGMRIEVMASGKKYEPLSVPPKQKLYRLLTEKGPTAVKENIKAITAEFDLPYDNRFLNWFGYQLLQEGKKETALEVFRLNTELFPKVANTWDSLAESYAALGNKEKALELYRKVMAMEPGNKNAQMMITRLQEEKK